MMFLCSCPEFMAPEVVLSGQGLSPLFGPSGPKVLKCNESWLILYERILKESLEKKLKGGD